jgi:predicted nucleotidyltransferase
MIYTIEEIKEKITPVALKHKLSAVYVYGSYGRLQWAEAYPDYRDLVFDEDDVDILVDEDIVYCGSDTRSAIHKNAALRNLHDDLRKALGKPVDLMTTAYLELESEEAGTPRMVESILEERMQIYGEPTE